MAQDMHEEAVGAGQGGAGILHGASVANEHAPRPLISAIAALPQRYLRVLTKPAVATYREDIGKGSWSIVWLQLLVWAILDGLLGLLVNMISSAQSGAAATASSQVFSLVTSVGLIVIVPLLFFLIVGLLYLLTRGTDAGEQGTFLDLCSAAIQVEAPLGIASKLLALIPVVGRILNSVLSLYGILLIILVVMAVRRQSAGRAIIALVLAGIGALLPVAAVYVILLQITH
jgi:hypothetical protein